MPRTDPSSILPLVVRGISYRQAGRVLVRNCDVVFDGGKRSFLLGHNGAGKSLILNLLHGILEPCSGSIAWRGPNASRARENQAMVFQRPVMLRRRVVDNIRYALALRRIPRLEWDAIVDKVLDNTGLSHCAEYPARLLSFGQQQCLALARAWAVDPQVLFLDEPTSSLDPISCRIIEDGIMSMHRDGCTIIAATHDLGQARRLSDEILFIDQGMIVEKASTAEFFANPRSGAARNFLEGMIP